MAASQPRRGASVDQDQRLYTIRPLRWFRSQIRPGKLSAFCSLGEYTIERDKATWVVRMELLASNIKWTVCRCEKLRDAKAAADNDHAEQLSLSLKLSLKPAGKAVRRG